MSILPPEGEYLTTGWEPQAAAADSVVRQAVLAHAAWAVELARAGGRPWRDGDSWAAAHCGDTGPFTNCVVLKQPPADISSLVGDANEFFPASVPYLLVSPWPTSDLRALGLALVGHPPLMLRVTSVPTEPPRTHLDVRKVTDAAGLADAERVVIEGYPVPELQPYSPGALYGPALLDGLTSVIVAYDDGTPVATSVAFSAHDLTLVENVAVMPSARGRGLGAVVTWAATVHHEGQPAALIASDDGQPVYRRLGYLRLERWTIWLRP